VQRRCGNGIVYTWGIKNDGRLGIEISDLDKHRMEEGADELFPAKPQIVKFGQGVIISKVSCGSTFTLALQQKVGNVYAWGMGNSGGLGLGEVNKTDTPIRIKIQKNGQAFTNLKDIACGAHHCIALDNSGICFSWGHGQGGRLGNGDETGEN
jgi:alpha-tubulin suppressor-like RCC1 family protein